LTAVDAECVKPGVVMLWPWVMTLGRVAGQVLDWQIPAGARDTSKVVTLAPDTPILLLFL